MLKACWDCIAGYNANREHAENGDAYDIKLNGDTQRAPPWPNPQFDNEIMFLLPKKLNTGDQINVSGQLRNGHQRFTVSLITGYNSPDYGNIACQIEAQFPPSYDDKVLVKTISNGIQEEINGDFQDSFAATDYFTGSRFSFTFEISNSNGEYYMDIFIGGSALEPFRLKQNIDDIRFLSIQGDVGKVDKLDFQFA